MIWKCPEGDRPSELTLSPVLAEDTGNDEMEVTECESIVTRACHELNPSLARPLYLGIHQGVLCHVHAAIAQPNQPLLMRMWL